MRMLYARQMTGSKSKNNLFFYNRIRALENRWTKCISVAGDYVKNDQTWCTYVVVNCVRLRTLCTPLVFYRRYVLQHCWNLVGRHSVNGIRCVKNLFLQSLEDSTLGAGLTWSNFQKGWLITESISRLLATISYLLTYLLLVS